MNCDTLHVYVSNLLNCPQQKFFFFLLTLAGTWTADGAAVEAAGLECVAAKAGLTEGLRAMAGIRIGAVVRHLWRGLSAAGW